jgi:hypothetical protein
MVPVPEIVIVNYRYFGGEKKKQNFGLLNKKQQSPSVKNTTIFSKNAEFAFRVQ